MYRKVFHFPIKLIKLKGPKLDCALPRELSDPGESPVNPGEPGTQAEPDYAVGLVSLTV